MTLTQTSIAQVKIEVKSLTASGEIPSDISTKTSIKVQNSIATTKSESDSKKSQKTEEQFLLKSNYLVDETFNSGRVIFGDDISKYVNNIANKLLTGNDNLKQELRFYVIRSNQANAFSTHQGAIFITSNLLARINTEDQLAFILSHEIAHYQKKHVFNKYLEASRVINRKQLKYSSYDENIRKLSKFSKTFELEADAVGFQLFKKAGYSEKAAEEVFGILRTIDYPIDTLDIDLSFLELKGIPVNKTQKLSSLKPIKSDNQNWSYSHPDIEERIQKISALYGSGELTKSDKSRYAIVKLSCFVESINQSIQSQNFIDALFDIAQLKRRGVQHSILTELSDKCYYGLAVYTINGDYGHRFGSYQGKQGALSRFYKFFEEMSKEELTLFCSLKVSSKSPYSSESTKFILSEYFDTQITSEESLGKFDNFETEPKNKLDSITALILKSPVKSVAYKSELNQTKNNFKAQVNHTDSVNGLSKKERKQYDKTVQLNPLPKIKKLVFVDPDFIRYNSGSSGRNQLLNSNEKKEELLKLIEETKHKSGLELKLLSAKNCVIASEYNMLGVLNATLSEVSLANENDMEDGFIPSYRDQLQKIIETNETQYYCYMGFVDNIAKEGGAYYYVKILDIKNGKIVYSSGESILKNIASSSLERVFLEELDIISE